MEPVLPFDILFHIAENYLKKTMLWLVSRASRDAFQQARHRKHVALFGPRFDTLLLGSPGDKWRQQFLERQAMINAFGADAIKKKQQLTLPPIRHAYLRHLLHELCEALGLVHESVYDHTSHRAACCRCYSSRIHRRANRDGYESQDELECDDCHLKTYWRCACVDVPVQHKVIIVRRDRVPSKRSVKRANTCKKSCDL
jgi:hypothetical protein